MKAISLIKGFLTVGAWTMMSRVLGFAREIMIAAYLGAGPMAEAFYVAFSLPNMFRRFFAEGAFNLAFVPMFARKLESDDSPLAFARAAFAGLAFVLIVFSAIAMIAMPALVWAMAAGFVGDARFDLAVGFGRIAFPYIIFISLAALLSGVLNATGRFAAAAAAPVVLNVLLVGAMALAARLGGSVGQALIWTVPVAGVAQLALVWVAAAQAGYRLTLQRPRLTPELKRLAMIAAPAVLAGGVVQINLLVGRQVASRFDGAIAWLSYADRLYQLPLGVVGIAVGVVLLPALSRRLEARDDAGGRDALNRAIEMSLALTIPAAVALCVIPEPLVAALFERGAFTAADTQATALAVAIYGLGLPAFVLQKCLQPLFYARSDTRTPFRYAVWSMIVNVAVAVGLMPVIGFVASAVATTIAAWAMVAALWWGSRRLGDVARLDARLTRRLPRIVAAALMMGALLWAVDWAVTWAFGPGVGQYVKVLAMVVLGISSYFAAAHAMGGIPLKDLKGALRR